MTATIPQERLRSLIRRHEAVAAMLSTGHTGDDYVRLSREFAELDPVAEKARALSDTEGELFDTEALIADPATDREMRALAEDERRTLVARIDLPAPRSLVRGKVPVFGLAYGDGFTERSARYTSNGCAESGVRKACDSTT